MKYYCGLPRHERQERRAHALREWHRWYAWYPVRIDDATAAWLEYVARRKKPGYDNIWEYKGIEAMFNNRE